jgi:CBS-domain-containing membrane protein
MSKKKLRGLNPRVNYTDRPTLVGEVSAKFADRGCHVVSVTDPYGHILGFLDQSR